MGLEKILTQIKGQSSVIDESWLQELRQVASKKVLEGKFPGKREEDWQFTDLSNLQKHEYEIAHNIDVTEAEIAPFLLSEGKSDQLVFVNGKYQAKLSKNSTEGVYVGNLAGLSQPEKLSKYLGEYPQTDIFTSLNKAGMDDLAIIWVKENVAVKEVIQLLFLTAGEKAPSLVQPHILIVVEKNSQLQFTETYQGLTQGGTYWTNSVSQIFVQENAQVEHTRIQAEAKKSFHLAMTNVQQSKNSVYKLVEISLGGQLSRHNLEILQQGEQTETRLFGLSIGKEEQIIDTHTKVSLNHPYGTVEQLQKCVLDGRSQAIFNGKVIVPQAAQMTNAAQLNRNLLLSPGAKVNTKPELQITADNVKCSHGATVSELEEEEIFYLRSRGLTLNECRNLLVEAFAAEIINLVPYLSLRQRIYDYYRN